MLHKDIEYVSGLLLVKLQWVTNINQFKELYGELQEEFLFIFTRIHKHQQRAMFENTTSYKDLEEFKQADMVKYFRSLKTKFDSKFDELVHKVHGEDDDEEVEEEESECYEDDFSTGRISNDHHSLVHKVNDDKGEEKSLDVENLVCFLMLGLNINLI